jgi:hypothetical protein
MVNLSQGIDKLLKGQSKLSLEIKKVQKLQHRQLVCISDVICRRGTDSVIIARYLGNPGSPKTS